MTGNDLTYAHLWHEPRFGHKAFTIALETMFKELYRYDIKYFLFGKPEEIAYEFAERLIEEQCRKNNIEVSTFYMIGDNPESDIEGGIRIGNKNLKEKGENNWKTILLKTGVWKEGQETNGAHFVVDDMQAAFELILKEEGLI